MRDGELRNYLFERSAQWKAGVYDMLLPDGDALRVPRRIEAKAIDGNSKTEANSVLSVDPCSELYWLRSGDFELMRSRPQGAVSMGKLHPGAGEADHSAIDLVVGAEHIWMLAARDDGDGPHRLYHFLHDGLQRLATPRIDMRPLAIASDRDDGIWVASGGDPGRALRIDRNGKLQVAVTIDSPLNDAAIASSHDGLQVYVLDASPVTGPCDAELAFRLWRIDLCKKPLAADLLVALPKKDCACYRDYPEFTPDRLAAHENGELLLLDRQRAELWRLSPFGELLGRHTHILGIPRQDPCETPSDDSNCADPAVNNAVTDLAAGASIFVSHPGGIATLVQLATADHLSIDGTPTYVTPVLHSPIGVHSGWLRADIDTVLDNKSAIEVSVAASSDPVTIEKIESLWRNGDFSMPSQLLRITDELNNITDAESHVRVYRGSTADAQQQRLRVPLDDINHTHLWLTVRIHTAEGSAAPDIRRLRVIYPNVSFMRYLPAVYRENPESKQTTQRMMAVFESVFGDVDVELDALPARLDPDSTPDDWIPFLLRWLGFPAPSELSTDRQRRLLQHAHEILTGRGTMAGLRRFLQLAVDRDFEIDDRGLQAAPWSLPGPRVPGRRLGVETLVLCQRQPGFRLLDGAVLGQQPLGESPMDPAEQFSRRSATVVIRISDQHSHLRALIERYLPYLVPAHCRYVLRFEAAEALQSVPVLDDDFVLQSTGPTRLGSNSELGRHRLPEHPQFGITLGPSTYLDGNLYLS